MSALAKDLLLYAPGLELYDVRCASGEASWSDPELVREYGVVFVRRGCFRRRVRGVETVLEPGVVYFERPGDRQEVMHPGGDGDACTAVTLSDELARTLWGGEPRLPDRPVFTTPAIDLAHRTVLEAARAGDALVGAEAVVALVAAVIERFDADRVARGRPATAESRRRIVDGVRQRLALAPATGLLELADELAVSPHHLSRVFREETGQTISAYRNRVRVRHVLERLSDGEESLARLAADLGFADHAHMTRVVRDHVGDTPSSLRRLFAAAPR